MVQMAFAHKITRTSTLKFLLQEKENPRKLKTLITFVPYSSMASWSCTNCTFINSPSQKSTETHPQSSSFSANPKWACKACTFLNSCSNSSCQLCGTRAYASVISTFKTDGDDGNDSVDSCGFVGVRAQNKAVADMAEDSKLIRPAVKVESCEKDHFRQSDSVLDETHSTIDLRTLKILSYNVWFREDLEMHERMIALGYLIQLHSPDLICLQEVTPSSYYIFQQSSWWNVYNCSVSNEESLTKSYFCMQLSKLPVKSFDSKPFHNSIMGRELCFAEVAFGTDIVLVIATSHLESPCPGPPKWDQMYSKERVNQAKEALNFLKANRNVIFCGDMNWDDKIDGQVPLPEGWVDAWEELRPGEVGWTYDTKSNMMLSGNRKLQKRLDRFLCHLRDFKIHGIEMIGMEAIPGLSYCKEKRVKGETKKLVLPVLPSDHYGLLLTIRPQ